jgi:prepilin-type N-terminal cleavage/methylation domain-containing protein
MFKKLGFSLIELMIVIAIIIVLSMIAVPNFMKYLSKAKRAEAYMQLSSLYTAEKAYWAEHGKYATQLAGQGGIGWSPEGYSGGGSGEKFYYTYGFGGSEGTHYFTGKLGTSSNYLSNAYANENGFLAVAVGDIDGDGQPDILAVDQNNNITILQDDLA